MKRFQKLMNDKSRKTCERFDFGTKLKVLRKGETIDVPASLYVNARVACNYHNSQNPKKKFATTLNRETATVTITRNV
jgi:hypothetical protein